MTKVNAAAQDAAPGVAVTPDEVLAAMEAPQPAERAEHTVPPFPVEVLPTYLQDMVEALRIGCGFVPDFTVAGMLATASMAIGNARHLKVREGYTTSAALWQALVGPPGVGKSHPVNTALKPLTEMDARSKAEHDRAMRDWNALHEERRKHRPKKDEPPLPPLPPPPVWHPYVVGDITLEALTFKLAKAGRGIGLHVDELKGWLKRFDQYRSGGDRQAWLTIHNGSQLVEVRKTAGEQLVRHPFVPIVGGIQPGVIASLGKEHDGLLDRILFYFPDDVERPYASTEQLDPEWAIGWATIVQWMVQRWDGSGIRVVSYSKEAAQALVEWDRMNTDRINEANARKDGRSATLYAKADIHLHRLALVLDIINEACGEKKDDGEVGLRAFQGAVRLVEYFEASARQVLFRIFEADAIDDLPPLKARIYAALPDQFKTGDGIKIAGELGMRRRSFTRMLRDAHLFRKDSHGVYLKLKDV